MKPLIEFSIRTLGGPTETGHRRFSSIFPAEKCCKDRGAGTIEVLCDPDEAEMLLQVAKHFCPDAVPEIEKEIRLVQRVSG